MCWRRARRWARVCEASCSFVSMLCVSPFVCGSGFGSAISSVSVEEGDCCMDAVGSSYVENT